MKLKLFTASVLLFALISCDKEPSAEDPIVSTWRVVENYHEDKIDAVTMINDEPCFLDDLYIIKSNGNFSIDNGPTKCDPSDPQTFNGGIWKKEGNTFEFGVPGDMEKFNILKLDEHTFEIVDETEYYKTYFKFERVL